MNPSTSPGIGIGRLLPEPVVTSMSEHEVLELAKPVERRRWVSLLMPTQPPGDAEQDRIRWANLMRVAAAALEEVGMGAAERNALLRRIRTAEAFPSTRYPGHGLAVFAAPDRSVTYRVPGLLPEIVAVGRHCLVGPLLPVLSTRRRVVLLELSGDEIRLLDITPFSVEEIPLEGLPLAPFATMPRQRRQLHAFVADSGNGGTRAVFHGTGREADVGEKEALLRYCRQIDEAIRDDLSRDRALLILAGVGYVQDLYREASTYRSLLHGGVRCTLRGLPDAEIHARAWSVAQPVLEEPAKEAASLFRALAGTGRTLTDPVAVAAAAQHGRVDALLLSAAPSAWRPLGGGSLVDLDDEGHNTTRLNTASVDTVRRGGAVFALPPEALPGPGPIAAVLRY